MTRKLREDKLPELNLGLRMQGETNDELKARSKDNKAKIKAYLNPNKCNMTGSYFRNRVMERFSNRYPIFSHMQTTVDKKGNAKFINHFM